MEPYPNNIAPRDPYTNETPEERHKRRLKEIKKNRFNTADAPQSYITQGMQNMNISEPNVPPNMGPQQDFSPSTANVPSDMRQLSNPTQSYSENNTDYSRIGVGNGASNLAGKVEKPRDDLNMQHVRTGMLQQYSKYTLDPFFMILYFILLS